MTSKPPAAALSPLAKHCGGAIALLILAMLAVAFLPGCPKPDSAPAPGGNAAQNATAAPGGAAASGKTKIIAYINLTSGCQAETVDLLNKLGMDNADRVEIEFVDFGSPEGEQRWRKDGLQCMTLLFDGSPALKFAGYDGVEKTVVFTMPAGFSWTHDDLQEAFAALKAGKAKILTEEEARQEMEPKSVKLTPTTRERGSAADVLVNGKRVIEYRAKTADKSPAQRAADAKAALETWASGPLNASELSVAPKNDSFVILAQSTLVTVVTPADAKAAGMATPKLLAAEWLKALKGAAIQAPAVQTLTE